MPPLQVRMCKLDVNERSPMARKNILAILLVSFTVISMLCSKGQTVVSNNQPPQEPTTSINPVQDPNTSKVGIQFALANKVVPSSEFQGYKTYKNYRFGYSIDYPSDYTRTSTATNGDGIILISANKEATLWVAGGHNGKMNIKDFYDIALKRVKGEIEYTALQSSWYVLTWKENNNINYEKMFVVAGSHYGFTFSYPNDRRAQYDDVVSKLEASFQPRDMI